MTERLSRSRRAERRPIVFFCTSNVEEKFLQARLILGKRGFDVRHFRTRTEPYAEDYSKDSAHLIKLAIRSIADSVGRTSLFFVEDTSLRIDALSDGEADFPGLSVKEWFAETSFEDLQDQLQGLPRTAAVKSDIGLHVPGLDHPVMFHGEIRGTIADSVPEFAANSQFPWLRPDSFNGWFVPEGAEERLGEMSLERSLPYDFRVKALTKLADRLDEYVAIINLSPRAVAVRTPLRESGQQPLFSGETTYAVVGRLCAGKTTFGTRALNHGFRHIEASDQLKALGQPSDSSDESKFEFAQKMLREHGPDIVARLIVERFGSDLLTPTVITGFRAIEEIVLIRDVLPTLRVIHLESNERLRYERFLRRGRSSRLSLEEFRAVDQQQGTFGLLQVASDLCDIQIVNESSLEEYLERVDFVIGARPATSALPGVNLAHDPRRGRDENRLFRLISILSEAGRPLTTEDLEKATRRSGRPIRHNNANKVLKKFPALADRLDTPASTRVRYAATSAGRAYVRLMMEKYGQQNAG